VGAVLRRYQCYRDIALISQPIDNGLTHPDALKAVAGVGHDSSYVAALEELHGNKRS